MQGFLAGRTFGFALSIAIVAGIAFLYRHVLLVNQTTVALTLLLAILAVSAVWGMVVSVFMSLAAMLVFNYEFLPPGREFDHLRPPELGGSCRLPSYLHHGQPTLGADPERSRRSAQPPP